MKRVLIIIVTGGMLIFATQFQVLARGGGGGGGRGGGGGGAARSGGGFSPSAGASRPTSKPASARPSAARSASGAKAATRPAGGKPGQPAATGQRPAAGAGKANAAAGKRPTSGQVNNFLDVSGGAKGAAGAAKAATAGGVAANFLQGGTKVAAAGAVGGAVGAGTRVEAGRPGTPGENLSQNRPGRIENRGERQGDRDQRRDQVRSQYEANNPGSFWEENPGWAAFAVTRPLAWATWGSVGSWCGYGGQAAPYSYGENIYYSGDQVYSGDQPIATTEEYAQQAEALATSDPGQTPEKEDWLPLGVFALTQDGQASGTEPTIFMQLAISKQGVISGTFKNTLAGKAQPIEGMADKKSQRVAWCLVDQTSPIMETGLSNLTEDTSPALIHFSDGQTQQWLMVRMPDPKS